MKRSKDRFGSWEIPKPKDRPAPRRTDLENQLCEAIRKRVCVRLTYRRPEMERLFQPSAVYHSTQNKVCVAGVQITNPAKPQDNLEPHDFEVDLVRSLTLTDRTFVPDLTFDRSDPKYRNGVICSI